MKDDESLSPLEVGWLFTVAALMIMHFPVLTKLYSICPLTHCITALQLTARRSVSDVKS